MGPQLVFRVVTGGALVEGFRPDRESFIDVAARRFSKAAGRPREFPRPTGLLVESGIAVAEETELLPLATEIHQRYTRFDAEGRKVEELWTYSWFASAGTLEHLRTRGTTEEVVFTAPTGKKDDPVPTSKRVLLWAVVRDGRGGVDWVTRELRLGE